MPVRGQGAATEAKGRGKGCSSGVRKAPRESKKKTQQGQAAPKRGKPSKQGKKPTEANLADPGRSKGGAPEQGDGEGKRPAEAERHQQEPNQAEASREGGPRAASRGGGANRTSEGPQAAGLGQAKGWEEQPRRKGEGASSQGKQSGGTGGREATAKPQEGWQREGALGATRDDNQPRVAHAMGTLPGSTPTPPNPKRNQNGPSTPPRAGVPCRILDSLLNPRLTGRGDGSIFVGFSARPRTPRV